jgi:hypothetical protein
MYCKYIPCIEFVIYTTLRYMARMAALSMGREKPTPTTFDAPHKYVTSPTPFRLILASANRSLYPRHVATLLQKSVVDHPRSRYVVDSFLSWPLFGVEMAP